MRLVNLLKQLDALQAVYHFDRVYYEEVRRHRGTDAAHWYGAFWGQIIAWCDRNKIPYEGVSVGSIKKFWAQNGNASKDMMIAECERRGIPVETDDQADAIALFFLKIEDEKTPWSPAEDPPRVREKKRL